MTTTIYKIVETSPSTMLRSPTIIRVGSDTWEPTPDQLGALVEAYMAAAEDPNATVLAVRHDVDVKIAPSPPVMVKCDEADLVVGDHFVKYRVTTTFDSVAVTLMEDLLVGGLMVKTTSGEEPAGHDVPMGIFNFPRVNPLAGFVFEGNISTLTFGGKEENQD